MTQDFYRDGGDACVNSVKKSWNIVKNYGKTGTKIELNYYIEQLSVIRNCFGFALLRTLIG